MRHIAIIGLCIACNTALAQTLTAEAPSTVMEGEQFRLTYTVNTQDADNIEIGTIPDGLEVLIGPNASYQSSYQMINGKTSSSQTITYTYIVYATKKGTYTIPAAHIKAGGKMIESNSLSITVTDNVNGNANSGSSNRNNRGNNSSSQRQQQRQSQRSSSGTNITAEDLFIRVSASKTHVTEQEPILLTYKVYTLVDLTQLSGKMPDLTGFHTQEIELPQQKTFSVEQYNGKSYRTVTWSQYVMFPQKTGELEIPSITFHGVVAVRNRYVDPFEAFFNGGSGYTEIKHDINAASVKIKVDPLPTRPADFSGAVGKFTMTSKIDKTETKTNEPVTVKVTVNGAGNMKLIKAPEVVFPADFDTYDVKTNDNTKLTTKGVEGSITYEYLAVPREQGSYDIPAIKFVYYDVNSKSYKTLTSDAFTIDVAKNPKDGDDAGNFISTINTTAKEETDIRDLKIYENDVKSIETKFFLSTTYKIILAGLVLVFIALFIAFQHMLKSNPDMMARRERKANAVATKRLKKAKRLMMDNNQGEFYDEVLRALWGYIGDKLHLPVAQISRENISQQLTDHCVKQEIIDKFLEALDECEFERYAPGDVKGNMNKTFDTAMSAIMQIEEGIRKRPKFKKDATAKMIIIAVLFSCMGSSYAVTKDDADSLYLAKKYKDAIAAYEDVLKTEKSAALLYNLGNAYYRTGNNTKAIISYERAKLYSPWDEDIKHNLKIANGKTTDKIVARPKVFFVEWIDALLDITDMDGWARASLWCLALVIIMAAIYFFVRNVGLRKMGFAGVCVFLVCFIIATLFAWRQNTRQTEGHEAIITAPYVLIKKSPSNGSSDLFMLHEGTKIEILDGDLMDWKEIRVPDGRKGWIETAKIEEI